MATQPPTTATLPAKPAIADGGRQNGLASDEARRRLKKFGPNAMPNTSMHPLRTALEKFCAPVPWMLEAAIVLELVLGKYVEAAIIAILLVFNALLGLLQESRAQATLTALKSRLALSASVCRDGAWKTVPATELVPGDLVKLSLGGVVAADGTSTPDQNYAREVMQLMTIGLYKLNSDGSRQLDASGNAIPTYSQDDILGLSKVFTGLAWYSPTPTTSTFNGGSKDPNATITPMIVYNQFHSISSKTFLGVTIPATTTADTAGEIKIALDTLFNHPNVGPFIAFRLIQQLVTSNPSPAYIGRVAAVFNNNGAGVRGDMAAVVTAILTDSEARDTATDVASASFGKLREPVVRLANWMRAFSVTSQSGNWLMTSTSANTSLGEAPLTSSSVFNFRPPGYAPPNTQLAANNLLSPEFQGVDEVTVAGYLNTMQGAIGNGIGSVPTGGSGADIQSAYTAEMAVATDANALADRMNLLLLYGQMSATLRQRLVDSINGVTIPGGTATQAQINAALLNRAKIAVMLTMASPDYLVQR